MTCVRAAAPVMLVSFLLASPGCANILGIEDFVIDAGTDLRSSDAARDTSGSFDDSDVPDTSDPSVDASRDTSMDALGDGAGCVAVLAPPDATVGIFVAPLGTDNPTCGVPQAPCLTVQVGIERATGTSKRLVYVAPGTFVEALTLRAGVTVSGGWLVSAANAWTYDCAADASSLVTLQASSGARAAVTANALGGASTLVRLTVLGKPSSAVGLGESVVGVLVRGPSTSLALRDVIVRVPAGGNGIAGTTGAVGAAPASSCSASNGQLGTNGTPGSAGSLGTFTSTGYTAAAGGTGTTGSTGNAGTAGTNGTCVNGYTCTTSAGTCVKTTTSTCGTAGVAGCGGGGGVGGRGGGAGGSSVALDVWNAEVDVVGGELRAGNGGLGANGGT
ncbi:MAG: hypothetical protein WCI05_19515, partial [Myxococcales bacterium]